MNGTSSEEPPVPQKLRVEASDDYVVHDEFSDDPFNYEDNVPTARTREILAEKEHTSTSAADLLNEALRSSPFARMEDLVDNYQKTMVLGVRNAYFVTSFNFWNKQASVADLYKANVEYEKALPRVKRELDRIKGISEEDRAHLLRSFVVDDVERLNVIHEALMSEKKQASAERIRKTIAKMSAGVRRVATAALVLFVASSAEVPSSPTLPTYRAPVIGKVTPERRVVAEATARGANHMFYRFFRTMRYTDPKSYERLAGNENPLAISERFAQLTGFWKMNEGENRSAMLQDGDRIELTPQGEVVFIEAGGVRHELTQNGQPVSQDWPQF
ncbi:MAG TPA: hypothetical protein PK109_00495 [Candidatus Paceibacterota bacterium]|nr:hypothetical protein [Candidatus Paceibacterota bacterium]